MVLIPLILGGQGGRFWVRFPGIVDLETVKRLDFSPQSKIFSFSFCFFVHLTHLSLLLIVMSESELSEVPSREASPVPSTNHPLSKVGTESTTGTDPGDNQSVYRPPAGCQTRAPPIHNRPRRAGAQKRTSTQARLSVSTVTPLDFDVVFSANWKIH